MVELNEAPEFQIPRRELVAVEHPMRIRNLDKGLKTFGRAPDFRQMMSTDDGSALPLYLHPEDYTNPPILSHSTSSNCVVLKITVPRRTGRKRKRGSDEPYVFQNSEDEKLATEGEAQPVLKSHSGLDDPKLLQRSLKDNIGKYDIEGVGFVEQTHRYRGMADFFQTTSSGAFMNKFRDHIVEPTLNSLKTFNFAPERGLHPPTETIPPPSFSHHPIPFNYAYSHNVSLYSSRDPETGEVRAQRFKPRDENFPGYVASNVPHDKIPSESLLFPPMDEGLRTIISRCLIALDERPIWAWLALSNHLGVTVQKIRGLCHYFGYRFKSGPWRDTVIKFGVDPRTDVKYRFYQTLFFKARGDDVQEIESGHMDGAEETIEGEIDYRIGARRRFYRSTGPASHVFTGKLPYEDLRIWQLCDIKDPVLLKILETRNLRVECDFEDTGWFYHGTIAKLRAIMRTKFNALQIGRELDDSEFEKALTVDDNAPLPEYGGRPRPIRVPVPEWRVSPDTAIELGVDPLKTPGAILRPAAAQSAANESLRRGSSTRTPESHEADEEIEMDPQSVDGESSSPEKH